MNWGTKEGYRVESFGGFIRCTQLPPDGKTEYDKQYLMKDRQEGGGWIWGFDSRKQSLMYPSQGIPSTPLCVEMCTPFFPFPPSPCLPCFFLSVIDSLQFEDKLREKSIPFFFVVNYKLNYKPWEREFSQSRGLWRIWIWILHKRFVYTVVGKNQITGVNTETVLFRNNAESYCSLSNHSDNIYLKL